MRLRNKAITMLLAGVLAIASAFPAMATQAAAAGASQSAETQASVEVMNPAESAMNVICAPSGIMMMEDGTMLVTDTYNKVVWRNKDRVSAVIAGKFSVTDIYGEPVGGYNDAKLAESYFKKPWAIAPFYNGIAVSDSTNNVVRYIGYDGTQTAVGSGNAGFVNGRGMNAAFNNPTGLCWKGNSLYIAESGAHRILKVVDGKVRVVYGTGTEGDVVGDVTQAQFSFPQGVAVAEDGTIYVSDTGNSAIKKIVGSTVTTLLMCDNTKMDLYPISPVGLAVSGDKLYVCDNFAKKVIILNR